MKTHKEILTQTRILVLLSLFSASLCEANTMPNTVQLLGTYRSNGEYNLVGLGTWDGEPVSPTNRPSEYQAQLAATINFYADPNNPSGLFVQVTDVITTNASFWFGLAFQNVSQTGIEFLLPSQLPLGTPTLSTQYANPGEVLFTGSGSTTIPLSDTPGYGLQSLGNAYLIGTVNGAEDAFGTWGL